MRLIEIGFAFVWALEIAMLAYVQTKPLYRREMRKGPIMNNRGVTRAIRLVARDEKLSDMQRGLLEKSANYVEDFRWHNIEEDKTDLPGYDEEVLILLVDGIKTVSYLQIDENTGDPYFEGRDEAFNYKLSEVSAWCKIPQ